MKRQKRAFLFDSFDSAEGAFDLFQNSIRSGMNYDSNINDQFEAKVLTKPVKLVDSAAPSIFSPAGQDGGRSEVFVFMARIEGNNSPHRFLPDPCSVEYTKTQDGRRKAFNLIQQHIKVFMFANTWEPFPSQGDMVLISLERNQFGSFRTDVAKQYIKHVSMADQTIASQNLCSELKADFKLSGPTPLGSGFPTYTPVTTTMQEGIDLILKEAAHFGVTNPYAIVGMLAVSAKESGIKPVGETDATGGYGGTSVTRLRDVFNNMKQRKEPRPVKCQGKITDSSGAIVTATNWFELSDEQINLLKKDNIKFFALVYGNSFGNDCLGDGYRYRGRGLNQLTFKSNYKAVGDFIGIDLVADPDRVMQPEIAVKAMFAYYLKTGPRNRPASWWNNLKSYQAASDAAADATAGYSPALRARENANARLQQFIDMYKKGELAIPSPSSP